MLVNLQGTWMNPSHVVAVYATSEWRRSTSQREPCVEVATVKGTWSFWCAEGEREALVREFAAKLNANAPALGPFR